MTSPRGDSTEPDAREAGTRRRWPPWATGALWVPLLLLAHELLAWNLADSDLLERLLVAREPATLLLALGFGALRLGLIFCIPVMVLNWLLHQASRSGTKP